MERNKNRTDLLAAGRKKLQQFRQKKDGKGSNSRSLGKAGKSGRDATVGTAPDASVTEQHAADRERSTHNLEDAAALSESGSRADSVANDTTATTDELSAKADGPEIASFTGAADIPLEGSEVDEIPLNQTVDDGHDVVSGLSQEDRSSSLIIEDAKYNVQGTSDSTILQENSIDSSIYLPIDSSSELGRQHGEDQVTDVGATQEVGSSSGNQIDKDGVTELEGYGTLSSNEFSKIAEDNKIADARNTPAEEEANVATQLSKTDDAPLTGSTTTVAEEAQQMHDDSVVDAPLTESGLVSTVSSVVTGQLREAMSSGLLDKENTEMHNVQDGHGVSRTEGIQATSGIVEAQFSEFEINETADSLGCKQVDLSSILDGSVIKLSQLAETLQVLDEDEFRFLFMSRGSSLEKFKGADKIKAHESVVHDAFEKLKEQLYITSFSKDAFHLQLSEHQKLIDEVCAVNASLIEVQDKNRVFAEEIVQCRNELQDVVSEREDLQKQLSFSNSEIEILAAKVNELQNKLEMGQQGMLNLSSELADCKNLVETLQAANENLNGSLKEMNEEKIKLSEENGIALLENEKMREELAESRASLETLQTLQRDEQRRLQEENDSMVHEKRKFLADCAEYKITLESLEAEIQDLNEVLKSLSEERKKLEEDKVVLVQQIENRSRELMDCQDLAVTLQTEISNLSAHLMSITEERNKLAEEKQNIFSEYEKQYNELTQIKVLEASLQAECIKAVDDLKEATLRVEQLTEDNLALKADLDFHKLKIKEFDRNKYSSQLEEVANRGVENDASTLLQPESDCSSLEQLKLDVHAESPAFVALKRNLEDAEIVMQKLEKEIEGMHLHLTSFSRSTDKVATPGVSKLIQAFESKGHADDQEPEKHPSSEDVYMRTKRVTENLRVLLEKLVYDAENASDFCMVQSKLLDAAVTDRSKYDSLREHTDQVEEANIELMVLHEVMKDHICHAVAREGELLILCDALQKQELALKSENIQLREKLNEFQAKMSELQSQLDGIHRDSDEVVASMSNQVLTLQAEVADRETILEEEWNSVTSQVLQTIGVLDSTVKTFSANSLADEASNLDVVGRVAASVAGASKVIEDLQGQLEAAHKECEEISDKNDMAISTLNRLYNELNELLSRTFGYQPDETMSAVVNDKVLNLLNADVFNTLDDQLRKLADERLELQSENKQLNSELLSRAREINELQKKCLKSDTCVKLVEEIEQSLTLEGTDKDADEPASRLESLIYLLVQKYKESEQGLSLSTSLEMQLSDLRGQVEHLTLVLVKYENENLVFRHSLKIAEEDIICLNYKLKEKVAELEQSEQRVSSLREKLSIAVTKGKGLISQRDSLRQSLAETSKELEKCLQELLSKDAMLHELETKLKVYSEAGERMEALESELSYIRNSATALRESFLLKDSILQRIEEILEDLDLPEHFHSRDIIEKIDWLAKSVGGNSMPQSDWDRRSSVGGVSYSDAGFLGGDGLAEDTQPNLNSGDDLRGRYEDLQNQFYGLAEQNEMLEQSLMERNNLVQQWEEILDKVDMPSQLRSMEPEDKIQWMESALSEAENRSHSLQQKIDTLEALCGSLTANVEDSHRRTSELETAFQQVCSEKEILSRDLEILSHDNDENSKMTADFKIRNESLQSEIRMLQEQKLRMEEDFCHTENAIRRLQELVNDALQDSCKEDEAPGQEGIKYFEEMLTKLIEKYEMLSSGKPVNDGPLEVHATEGELSHTSRDSEEQTVETLTKKLENSMGEMVFLKEENDRRMLNNKSLLQKVEELEVKNKELQELFNQEEQKSASFREKLNVAVRKGKSLVQQRDGMKQVIEELNAEVERLKSQINHAEKAVSEYEGQIKNLSATQERVRIMESENIFLKDRLAETERALQEKEGSWSSVLEALDDIDVGIAFNSGNPIEKLKEIGKHLHDLCSGVRSLEQESRKSKRAAELLLAELNEVQERNDSLQEELAKAVEELTGLSRERDLAENAKYKALAHVEKLSHIHSEEKDRQLSEIMVLKSGVDNMREDLSAIDREFHNVLSKDLEIIQSVKAMMKSILESGATPDFGASFPGGVISIKSENKVFMSEIGSLREQLLNHSRLLQEEASQLSEVMMNVRKEFTSQKDTYEYIKRDVEKLELIEKEKESELHILRGNISLLYEACATAISEIENWKHHAVGNNALASRAPERKLIEGGKRFINDIHAFSEEGIRGMCDKLSLVMREFISMQSDLLEVGHREMKGMILNLQTELQEKDIQRDRICMELVNQIKEAETNAKNYLHDLEQVRGQLHASQRQLNVVEEEHNVLEQRIKELQDQETNSIDLQQKVNSLTDELTAKVQENEALMQALEEQEAEVEDLTSKIVGLENELQQKNKDTENLEASRSKALKKLSVTVSKFDELHYLSESLLSEVEKLQSQLQERDGEISFLRHEVTRCTNDALAVTQMNKKRRSDEIHELFTWIDSLISPAYVHGVASDDSESHLVDEYKEVLQKKILNLISDFENLRVVAQNSDRLLQEERSKVEELEQKEQYLKNSLDEKESQLVFLQGAGDSANATESTSEIMEVEQMSNKWTSTGNIAPQVRSLRKTNTDQVAIAIDVDQSSDRLEDDDDKAHGFKSLTTSRIVPRFTRPLSDMVDGLWVSCDRALMRQPALRLGVIIYWVMLHAMLATFVV